MNTPNNKINIDEIKIDNTYLRMNTEVESLMKSIETVGLISPLVINKDYQLLAGGRRYSALKYLGVKDVPVIFVDDKNLLQQELISIDENIVRKPLSKLEFEKCLGRGREIYEKLNPNAEKVVLEIKELSPSEKKQEKEKEQQDSSSFAAITSEKTGLSKGAIKKAIQRDVLSSDKVKEARQEGIISASQTNELVKLDVQQQDEILPYVVHKTAKDLKKVVDLVKRDGVDIAINTVKSTKNPPRDFVQFNKFNKAINKILTRINSEELLYDGIEMDLYMKDAIRLKDLLDDFIELRSDHNETYKNATSSSDTFENQVIN